MEKTAKMKEKIINNRFWEVLAELRFLHLDRLGTSTQATHIHSNAVVYFDEAPEPIHDAHATSLVQACDDAFYWTITIYLLVRQKL